MPRDTRAQVRAAGGSGTKRRTHHGDGRVELRDAHPAGRVLAVEALVRDRAVLSGLQGWLRGVRVQVDEFLTWAGSRQVSGRRAELPHHSHQRHVAGREKGTRRTGQVGARCLSSGGGAARETTPLPPTSLQTPLTHVADEVAGTVGLPSNHAQGLGHHEAVLRGGRQAGPLSEGLPAPPAAPGVGNRRRTTRPTGCGFWTPRLQVLRKAPGSQKGQGEAGGADSVGPACTPGGQEWGGAGTPRGRGAEMEMGGQQQHVSKTSKGPRRWQQGRVSWWGHEGQREGWGPGAHRAVRGLDRARR